MQWLVAMLFHISDLAFVVKASVFLHCQTHQQQLYGAKKRCMVLLLLSFSLCSLFASHYCCETTTKTLVLLLFIGIHSPITHSRYIDTGNCDSWPTLAEALNFNSTVLLQCRPQVTIPITTINTQNTFYLLSIDRKRAPPKSANKRLTHHPRMSLTFI